MTDQRHRPWSRCLPGIALPAILAVSVGTSLASAQESLDDWEWEPDEGYHLQEWYDPSDWFGDDTAGVNYEYDWDDYDYDYDDYDDDYVYDDVYDYDYDDPYDDDYDIIVDTYMDADDYYAAYYDGYYDGYYDDAFGYDLPLGTALDDDPYGVGYRAGYYDGYYDQVSDYDYDPYYYVYDVSETTRDRTSDRQRARDGERQRGDRRDMMGDRADTRGMDQASREHRRSAKLRGTVSEVSFLQGTSEGEPLIARVRMQDGRTGVVNLGPRMTRQDLPFAVGDRVTLSGRKTTSNDRQVLMVHTIQADGEVARIASRQTMRGQQGQEGRMAQSGQRGEGQWQDDGRQSRRQQQEARRERQQPSPSGQGRMTMRGEVDRIRTADVSSDRYRVWQVTLADGSRGHVAISRDRLDDMDLREDVSEGDRVMVQGRQRMIDGRRVLVADRLTVNGRRLGSDG